MPTVVSRVLPKIRRLVWVLAGVSALCSTPVRISARDTLHPVRQQNFPFTGNLLWQQQRFGNFHLSTFREGRFVSDRDVSPLNDQALVNRENHVPVTLSPDGHTVIMILTSDGYNGDVARLDIVTRRLRTLTKSGDYYHYAWSPDGRCLLCRRERDISGLDVLDAATGRVIVTLDQAFAPVWATDSRSVVFSRFVLDGRPVTAQQFQQPLAAGNLQRQFWAVSLPAGTLTRLSGAELDKRAGAAYRPPLAVDRRKNGVADIDYYPSLSPDGGQALSLTELSTPKLEAVQRMGFHEWPLSLMRTRLSLIDAHGIKETSVIVGGFSCPRWSRDQRYVYGVVNDGRKFLAAVDGRTGRVLRAPLGPEWNERAILDLRQDIPADKPARHRPSEAKSLPH